MVALSLRFSPVSDSILKSEDEIRERIEYMTKNKLKQRNEIETLRWVLGEYEDEN